jgi:hypothetical protein
MTTKVKSQTRPFLSKFEVIIPHEAASASFYYDDIKMILMFGDVAAAECDEEFAAGSTKVTFIGHETRDDS